MPQLFTFSATSIRAKRALQLPMPRVLRALRRQRTTAKGIDGSEAGRNRPLPAGAQPSADHRTVAPDALSDALPTTKRYPRTLVEAFGAYADNGCVEPMANDHETADDAFDDSLGWIIVLCVLAGVVIAIVP